MFESIPYAPLATRLRPTALSEVVGQDHLLGPDLPLAQSIAHQQLYSMILWGPPGCGKTTLAHVVAMGVGYHMVCLSAVLSGVKDIRQAVDNAKALMASGQKTVLFVDEIHRFSKSQQDAFLPHLEDGTLTLIGATTENPSFELNSALLSRARVHVIKPLDEQALNMLIQRALSDHTKGLGHLNLTISDQACQLLVQTCGGDARRLLNWLETASELSTSDQKTIGEQQVAKVIESQGVRFDKQGDVFYDCISALHKSIRGSDPDAALYWLCRMLQGGCDPLYLARRLVRIASEDVGNADPRALTLCLNVWDVQERLGQGEGELALAQAAIYLSVAPKSNAVYQAFNQAMAYAKEHGHAPVPIHLRNAPTRLMKDLGHGKAYRYAHNEPHGYAANEQYFPDQCQKTFYQPTDRGLEQKIKDKLKFLRSLDCVE